jgi:hypothetical protein
MIVNTKVFNYRFTIGTLILAIIALAAYGFSNNSVVRSENDFLKHEKKLLQKELNAFIERYDELDLENYSLKSQFEITRKRAQNAYDSLSILKANVAVLSRFRAELMFLRKQNEILQSDSLTHVIKTLENENVEYVSELNKQAALNKDLEEENTKLNATLEKGSLLLANSFEAKVYRKKNSGERMETDKASHAETVEVCFVIAENPLVPKGRKNLFIQILGPDNNVVNDKGAVNFYEYSLIYSTLVNVGYDNIAEEVCTVIPNNDAFISGIYRISVFENERKLGGTEIELN